jgi:hypothetical protein
MIGEWFLFKGYYEKDIVKPIVVRGRRNRTSKYFK